MFPTTFPPVAAIVRTADGQTMCTENVVSESPVKRNRRRRGKGGVKPIADGVSAKQAKQRFPTSRLIMSFVSALSPAEKGLVLALLLEQAKAAQTKTEGGAEC